MRVRKEGVRMKKEHWITMGLLILSLIGGCCRMRYVSFTIVSLIGVILFTILPLVMLFKSKIVCSIWAVGLTAWGTINLVSHVGEIIAIFPEKSTWNSFITFEDYAFQEARLSLESVCFVAFGLMIIFWLIKNIKSWILYIPATILLVLSFFTNWMEFCMEFGWSIIMSAWYEPLIFAISAYLLVHERPRKVAVNNIAASISSSAKTDFSYLDEYKRNMKK